MSDEHCPKHSQWCCTNSNEEELPGQRHRDLQNVRRVHVQSGVCPEISPGTAWSDTYTKLNRALPVAVNTYCVFGIVNRVSYQVFIVGTWYNIKETTVKFEISSCNLVKYQSSWQSSGFCPAVWWSRWPIFQFIW